MDGEPPLANNPLGRRKHEQLAKVTGGGYQAKRKKDNPAGDWQLTLRAKLIGKSANPN